MCTLARVPARPQTLRPFLLVALCALPVCFSAASAQLGGGIPGQASPAATGKTGPLAAANDPFAGEPLVIQRKETAFRMHADGTGERTQHLRMKLQSEGAVRQFSVLSFSYAAASETPHILHIRVEKPDGTSVETPVSEAIEMPAPVTREAPLYSDLKEKQVPVRSLAVGDVLDYEIRTTIDKPEAPGQFWGADHFTAPATLVVLAEVYTLEFPRDKYVQVWSPNHKPERTEQDGLLRYTWTVHQMLPTQKNSGSDSRSRPPKDPDQDADGRIIPSLAYTTFHNWAEVGDWYRGLAAKRADPTDSIKAEADSLTQGAKTPEEQARALYRFVSGIRYVGIDLGIGRFQPHPASEVLADRYGDCKDKDTLLEALMRAKGLNPAPALIGAGITPLPEVPTPAVFNHVITTLELPGTGRVWMDATAETAPFRLLNPVLRDEEALVVPPNAPAELIKTPADPPYPFYDRFDSTGTLNADGTLKSQVTLVFHSDDEAPLRQGIQQLSRSQWDAGAQYLSASMGFAGTATNADLTQKNPDDPLHVSYSYSREKYSDWSNLRILPLAPALYLPEPDTDDPDQKFVELGARRTQTVSSRLTLPAGYRADLPDGVHATCPWATYDRTYRVDDGKLLFDRRLVTLATKVPRSDFTAYNAFLKKISNGQDYYIQLTAGRTVHPAAAAAAPGKTASSTPPPQEAPQQALTDPDELIQQAMRQIGQRDWAGATKSLDQAKQSSESTPYLWAGYGLIQAGQEHYDAAIPFFQRELARHPDEGRVVFEEALVLRSAKKEADAKQLLDKYFYDHPDDKMVGLLLAQMQTAAKEKEKVVETLTLLSNSLPQDQEVRVQLANAYLAAGHPTNAAQTAKTALEQAGPDDSGILNDGAYALAESGTDLPLAESSSRKSLSIVEAKSATLTPDQVNSRSYADSSLLIAAWDTLGYILMKEGKLEEARNWFGPAWRNSEHPEVGLHLAEVEEKTGDNKQAVMTYRLALASKEGPRAPDVVAELEAGLARLHGKQEEHADTEGLLNLRMVHFKRPANLNGEATFRMILGPGGTVIGLEKASGDPGMEGVLPTLQAMTFPDLIPKGSQAHLLRQVVAACHSGDTCQLVFVINPTLANEN